ncbi:MAG TPA: recombination mediator RecR [Candidatus Saccharimonadales bacterium]|nr:recombination mediator RecR [Candidatus Saccharimonadales bacterium]
MSLLPPALTNLIEELGKLPGVGPRTAERYAYYLLRADAGTAKKLASAMYDLHDQVGYCQKTFVFVPKGQELSTLYTDPSRNKQIVAVVQEPFDVIAIERTGQFKGTYHVLGGAISPIDGVGPEQLHIKELLQRIEEDEVEEVILATNASVEGESTALFLQKQLMETGVRTTRLARGLPVGVDLEYADQITLSHALEGRQLL